MSGHTHSYIHWYMMICFHYQNSYLLLSLPGVRFARKIPKKKRKIRWFYHFATTRAHAYRSLKRKSQCQLWSLQWSIQSFLNVIFEQPSSFLQVQSTNNCLWVSQSYPKYGKYVFYPKIREPTSSCIWQIMPAAERIYHIYMLRYLCQPNWWS